ncbi:MAG: chromate transport protein ChrA [Oceanospirillaceae bacterium]|jgi:chromate transport protein ChrA
MKSWQLLGYLGLLPFIAFLYVSVSAENPNIIAQQAFVGYSAIIVSFIAGTLWRKDDHHINQQITSNALSLIAFLALFIERDLALIILVFSFILLFIYEKKLAKSTQQNNLNTNYMKMRFWLTLMVVSLHITAYFVWFY